MQKLKKYLALLLALVLCLSLLSVGVFADEDETAVDGDVTEETEVTDTEESGAADVAAEDQEPDIAESETADDADETTEEAEAEAPADTTAVDVELEEAVNSGETEEAAEIDESEKAPAEGDEAIAEKPAEEVVVAWEAVKAEVTVIEVQPQRWPQDADLTISRDAGDYNVTVDVPEGAFAEDVEFRVVALSWAELDADTYAQLIDAGMAEDDALLDIGFYSVETGEEVEPELAISVSIQTKAVEIAEVYHVEDEETITLVAEEVAEFTVESFSLYIVKSINTVVSIDLTGSMTNEQYSAAQEFTVSSAQGLKKLAEYVNSDPGFDFSDKLVTLTSDITLSDSWTPIGNGAASGSSYSGMAFKGTFDGNGHTISNLTISDRTGTNAHGLFGVVAGGTVKNFTLSRVSVSANASDKKSTGAAVGLLVENGTVSSVTVSSGTVTGEKSTGGVVGMMTISGTVADCVNNGASVSGATNIGGVVGSAYYTATSGNMRIENCSNSGSVTGTSGAGGIVGLCTGFVSDCKNTGAVTGNGTSVGGIVGEQKIYGGVNACTNSGNVSNSTAGYGVGGIVGWVRYSGLNDEDYPQRSIIYITNCENSGTPSGGNDAGGIVGTLYCFGTVTGNINTASSVSGSTFAAGIVGNFQWSTDQTEAIAAWGTDGYKAKVSNNVSTTASESVTANCKEVYVYDNTQGEHLIAEGNGPGFVAQIDQTKYTTLAAAIKAAKDNQTIKLLQEAPITTRIYTNKKFILDLNGKKVTCSTVRQMLYVMSGGRLTIQDSGSGGALENNTEGGSGVVISRGGSLTVAGGSVFGHTYGIYNKGGVVDIKGGLVTAGAASVDGYCVVNSKGTVTVDGGTVGSTDSASNSCIGIAVYGNGTKGSATLNVKSGSVIGKNWFAISGHGTSTSWGTEFNLEGGEITSSNSLAIYHPQVGVLNIGKEGSAEGPTIIGSDAGIEVRAGSLNMYGGSVVSTNDSGALEFNPNGSGSTVTGAGIAFVQHTTQQDIQIAISGGSVSGFTALAVVNPQGNTTENSLKLTVSGSTTRLTGKAGAVAVYNGDNRVNVEITGGIYSSDPSSMSNTVHVIEYEDKNRTVKKYDDNMSVGNYLADGYKAYKTVGAENSWTVLPDVQSYTVIFANWNGTELQRMIVAYGDTPVYTGSTPTRTASGNYVYTFSSFGTIAPATADVTYTAQFTAEVVAESDDDDDDGYVAPSSSTTTTTETEETVGIKDEATPLSALPEDYDEVTVTIGDEEVPLAEVPLVYSDVAVESWSRDAIAFVTATGIMNGTGDEEFAPIATSTGDMVATMVYRFATGDVTTGANWAEAGLAWASENALTEGIGFDANQATTREQLVTILYRMAAMEGYDVSASADLSNFADADKLSGFAAEAMSWAVSVGLIKGTSDTTLSSEDSVTREQIATIFMRYALLLGK